MKKFFTFLLLLFSFVLNTQAASLCSYKDQVDLNQKAANIKSSLEITSKLVHFLDMDDYIDVYNVSVLNLTDEFYVVVTNNVNDEKITLTSNDTSNNIASFEWQEMDKKVTFNFKVYTSSKTPCPDEVFKSFVATTSRYNDFSNMEVCKDIPEFSLCQKYIDTTNDLSETEFLKQVENYKKGLIDNNGNEIEENNKSFLNILTEYKWVILSVLLLSLGTIGIVCIYRKKKTREY